MSLSNGMLSTDGGRWQHEQREKDSDSQSCAHDFLLAIVIERQHAGTARFKEVDNCEYRSGRCENRDQPRFCPRIRSYACMIGVWQIV
jgi:hypothetical protein